MVWVRKIPLLAMLVLALGPERAFSEFYLKPGDSGQFVFTVTNATDSVDSLATPYVMYPNQPSWFSMDNVSVLAYDSLKQGTSCQITMDFSIADTAPSATEDLRFKVSFPASNVYPPVWYPAKSSQLVGSLLVVDATPPVLTVKQPGWQNYASSTTVLNLGQQKNIVRGPQANFTAYDAESGIADFQILNSSGVNLSADYFLQSFSTATYVGNLAEDAYTITALNKAGASTSGQIYVDYTPTGTR